MEQHIQDAFLQIALYATEWRIGDFIISERYSKATDKYSRGHPHPRSQYESIYAIHFVYTPNNYYSKSKHDFINIGSSSSRTKKDIVDTSFTLTEAIQMVHQIQKEVEKQ